MHHTNKFLESIREEQQIFKERMSKFSPGRLATSLDSLDENPNPHIKIVEDSHRNLNQDIALVQGESSGKNPINSISKLYSGGSLLSKKHDSLMRSFNESEMTFYPREGAGLSPPTRFKDTPISADDLLSSRRGEEDIPKPTYSKSPQIQRSTRDAPHNKQNISAPRFSEFYDTSRGLISEEYPAEITEERLNPEDILSCEDVKCFWNKYFRHDSGHINEDIFLNCLSEEYEDLIQDPFTPDEQALILDHIRGCISVDGTNISLNALELFTRNAGGLRNFIVKAAGEIIDQSAKEMKNSNAVTVNSLNLMDEMKSLNDDLERRKKALVRKEQTLREKELILSQEREHIREVLQDHSDALLAKTKQELNTHFQVKQKQLLHLERQVTNKLELVKSKLKIMDAQPPTKNYKTEGDLLKQQKALIEKQKSRILNLELNQTTLKGKYSHLVSELEKEKEEKEKQEVKMQKLRIRLRQEVEKKGKAEKREEVSSIITSDKQAEHRKEMKDPSENQFREHPKRIVSPQETERSEYSTKRELLMGAQGQGPGKSSDYVSRGVNVNANKQPSKVQIGTAGVHPTEQQVFKARSSDYPRIIATLFSCTLHSLASTIPALHVDTALNRLHFQLQHKTGRDSVRGEKDKDRRMKESAISYGDTALSYSHSELDTPFRLSELRNPRDVTFAAVGIAELNENRYTAQNSPITIGELLFPHFTHILPTLIESIHLSHSELNLPDSLSILQTLWDTLNFAFRTQILSTSIRSLILYLQQHNPKYLELSSQLGKGEYSEFRASVRDMQDNICTETGPINLDFEGRTECMRKLIEVNKGNYKSTHNTHIKQGTREKEPDTPPPFYLPFYGVYKRETGVISALLKDLGLLMAHLLAGRRRQGDKGRKKGKGEALNEEKENLEVVNVDDVALEGKWMELKVVIRLICILTGEHKGKTIANFKAIHQDILDAANNNTLINLLCHYNALPLLVLSLGAPEYIEFAISIILNMAINSTKDSPFFLQIIQVDLFKVLVECFMANVNNSKVNDDFIIVMQRISPYLDGGSKHAMNLALFLETVLPTLESNPEKAFFCSNAKSIINNYKNHVHKHLI